MVFGEGSDTKLKYRKKRKTMFNVIFHQLHKGPIYRQNLDDDELSNDLIIITKS